MVKYNQGHYEDVAKIIRRADVTVMNKDTLGRGIHMGVRWIKEDLADLFAKDNPSGCGPDIHKGRCFLAFSREQFFKDCEVN